MASDISTSTKGFTEETEARTVRIMKEGLTRSSKNLINERLDCQPLPMFNLCQNISSGLDPKDDLDISCHGQVSMPQIDCNIKYNASTTVSHFPSVLALAPPATETSSRECHFQSEGVSHSPEKPENSPKVIGDGSLVLAEPCQDHFTRSTQMVPYKFDGKTPLLSFMSRQGKLNQLSSVLASKDHASNTNFRVLEHECNSYHGRSAFLVCEKTLDDATSGKSGTSFARQSNASLVLHDPSGNNRLPVLFGEQNQKMQNCSSIGFFPSWCSSPEASKSELQKMPCSMPDVEAMGICTANSVEGLVGDPAIFSQTTHSLLFTNKMDVYLSKENQPFQESRVSANLKRNMLSELLSLSPPSGLGQIGAKFQPPGSSMDSEGKDSFEDIRTPEVRLKNESSAETDTMDIDACKEQNYPSGVNSPPSHKNILVGPNPPSQAIIASAEEEVECRWAITRLPDINEEIPALPAAVSSMDNAEPSTSRTQSLDSERLLCHAEQPSYPKSSPYRNGPPRTEPSSRWLKHLRLSASDSFGLGTKCSNLEEASSHKKVNKLFSKIMQGSKSSSSEPLFHKRHGKEVKAADQIAILLQNGQLSSVDSAKEDRDILLSHSWIQRWCHNRAAAQQKPEAVVVCEPETTNVEFDKLQNKQFPSIAAMALMGKAMSRFQPCEFQRRGSSVVWNTKGF